MRPRRQDPARTLTGALVLTVVAACSVDPAETATGEPGASSPPSVSPTPAPAAPPATATPSEGRQQPASLTVPAIGVRDLQVLPYTGTVDDQEGELIQNGGDAATPGGPMGGTGPGGIGNYLVSAHRTAATAAFRRLPELRRGDRVWVDADGTRYVYAITRTTRTSFRQPASKARQRAAVPGRPGARPTRAMISLITCATPEDHAVGNFWADEFGNPEHRIDKVGVLVATRPSG